MPKKAQEMGPAPVVHTKGGFTEWKKADKPIEIVDKNRLLLSDSGVRTSVSQKVSLNDTSCFFDQI